MKKTLVLQRTILVLVFGLALVLQGSCLTGPSPSSTLPPPPAAESPPPTSHDSSTEQIDKDIAELERKIEDTRDDVRKFQTESIMALEEHIKLNGWIRGVGDIEDPALGQHQRANANVRAGEMQMEQLKRKLAAKEEEKKAALNQSTGCFPPDTLVQMADGSAKPFSLVRPGDLVMTYDIGYQQPVGRTVVSLYTVDANHLYTINNELATTGGERLLSQDGWKKISNLKVGDRVHVDGCMIEVTRIDYHRKEIHLHNMQVDDTHNFYIATDRGSRYLVHNSGGGK